MTELTELERLEKKVADTYTAFHDAFNGREGVMNAYAAYAKARDELGEYLGTSAMTDEEKEQFYWDNPEAIPDKEQDNE